jgi:hypothetical protein
MDKDTALLLIVGLGAFGIYYLHNQPNMGRKRVRQCVSNTKPAPVVSKIKALSAVERVRNSAVDRHLSPAPMQMQPMTSPKMLGFANTDNNFFSSSINNHFL